MARRNLRELMVTDGVEDDSFIMSDVDTPLPSTGPEDAVKYGTRIEGLDAPEISRILPTGEVTEPSPGGEVYNTLIQGLQRKHGFKNIEYIKNKDGSIKIADGSSRPMVRVKDKYGRDFTAKLASEGLTEINKYSSPSDIEASVFGRLSRGTDSTALSDWEAAKVLIDMATTAESIPIEDRIKQIATDEKELAGIFAPQKPGETKAQFEERMIQAKYYSDKVVSMPRSDRNIMNLANNPWSVSFDTGLYGVMEGMAGFFHMTGEKVPGFDWLADISQSGLDTIESKFEDMPHAKLNALKPVINEDGVVVDNEWDIKNTREFFEFLGNNALVSLPYMVGTIGGAALAIPTGGLSMAPIVMTYTGQTWNEMEGDNKSATLAIASGVTQAVLDRLGLKGLKGTFMDKELVDLATKGLRAKNKGMTATTARNIIEKATRKEIALFAGGAAAVAKNQLRARKVIRAISKRAVAGSVTEGTTEALQELTGYMAAVIGSDKVFDAVELENRLINATIAGGTLGAGFSLPGAAIDAGAWTDIAVSQAEADPNKQSKSAAYAEEELKREGFIRSNEDINRDTGELISRSKVKQPIPESQQRRLDYLNSPKQKIGDKLETGKIRVKDETQNEYDIRKDKAKRIEVKYSTNKVDPSNKDMDQRAAEDKSSKKDLTAWDRVKDTWSSIPALVKGSMNFVFTSDLQAKSQAMRELADLFGANLSRIRSGATFENLKKHTLTKYKNMVESPADFATRAGFKKTDQAGMSAIIGKLSIWLADPKGNNNKADGEINWNNLPADLKPHETWLRAWYAQSQILSKAMFADQKKAYKANGKKLDLKERNNYLMSYKSFNKGMIEKQRAKFISALVSVFGMTKVEATNLTDSILNQDALSSDRDFEVGKGKFLPSSFKQRTLGLSDKPEFSEFMEQDAFVNISNSAKSAARVITYQEFLGDSNEKVSYKLNQAIKEGVSEREVNRVAKQMQDYLNAESGNYKRIQNTSIAKIQKNLGVWTTIASLPLATISSFVELATTAIGVPPKLIFKEMKNAAKEGASAMWATMTDPTWNSTNRQRKKESRQAMIKDLGFMDWDVGAAQTTGATETTHASRRLLDKYFRIIGLQQWTDYTRNIRGSIADDFIMNHLNTIIAQRKAGTPETNEVQESKAHLRDLGLDVEFMINVNTQPELDWDKEDNTRFDNQMRDARYNFINQAIALPGIANRPLFYQNQHLALFTQFQGFISTFTANQIPRMWGQYIKRGTPAMKYNAFAVMMTMIMLGFLSQYLKDLLKYGEPTPYLDPVEKIQRGLGASGLLGTGERVMNFMYPIYEQSSDNPAEWFFNTLSGEAAALSNVSRVYDGVGKIVTGQPDKGAYDIMKTAPFIGPFNRLNRNIAEGVFGKSPPKKKEYN